RAFDAALEAAREASEPLSSGPVEEWAEFIRLTVVEALIALERHEEANRALETAFEQLIAQARSIRRPDHRRAFLSRNEEIARLVELARDRLGRTLPNFSDPAPDP